MTGNICAGCHTNPTRDALTICQRCENQTRCGLADQAAHHRELITALTRMVKMSAGNNGGRGADRTLSWATMGERFLADITVQELREIASSLPPARPAADAMHSQRSLLVSWCRLLNDEGIARGLPADTIPAMACFVEHHLRDLRRHECAGELVREVRDLNAQIMRVIDTPASRTRVHVGPCIVEDDAGVCPGQVEAIIPRDEEKRPVLRCTACGAEWTAEHWKRVGELMSRRRGRQIAAQRLSRALCEQASA